MGNSNCFQSPSDDDDDDDDDEERLADERHSDVEPAAASSSVRQPTRQPVGRASREPQPAQQRVSASAPAAGFNWPAVRDQAHPFASRRPHDQEEEDRRARLAQRMAFIYQIPTGVFDGSRKARECAICMVDFEMGENLRYLPCMHAYHQSCIDDWLLRSFTCPSCMQPVDAALLATFGLPDD